MNTKMHLHNDASITLIRSYDNGKLRIGGTHYDRSVIVTSEGCKHWPLTSMQSLTAEDFSLVFSLGFSPELVILGTGDKLEFPTVEQTVSLVNAQIGLEVMDTAAACRTYNVLADDGRRVVACLLV